MSELFPTDAELTQLSGAADSEQGVPYPAIGESPYYVSFYRMLYRLNDVARRAGDLRVYKDGDLTFGVRPGRFTDGLSERSFAGATGQALTNNAVNFIYLSGDGTPAVSTAGFPNPVDTPHLPLAAVTTAAGSYDFVDVVDHRGRCLFRSFSPVRAGDLAGDVQAALPAADLTAGEESADTRTLTVQVQDAAGADLGGRFRLRVWIAEAECAAPSASGNTVSISAGVLLDTPLAGGDYELLTDADGTAAIDLTVTGAASRFVMVELGGRVVSSGELTFQA